MNNQDRFIRALALGDKPCRVRGVYGRIVRTMLPRPERLAEEPGRKVVMVMGPHGLKQLLGKSGYESLLTIGYTPEYIARNVARGMKFKLVLFDRPDALRIATWRVSVEFVSQHYPELAEILRAALADLKKMSLAEFEEKMGFHCDDVQKLGSTDPRFMTAQRLLESGRTAADARCFLFHALHFTDLYSGDGYTKTISGERGVREYLIHNALVETLRNVKVIELPVTVPDSGAILGAQN